MLVDPTVDDSQCLTHYQNPASNGNITIPVAEVTPSPPPRLLRIFSGVQKCRNL